MSEEDKNPITEDEIIKAEQKWGPNPSTPELQFCLATMLVKSSLASKIKRAIQLFHELRAQEKYVSEAYYYISLAHFSLGDLIEARIWVARLLRMNIIHADGILLKNKIDQAIILHRKHRTENLNMQNGQNISGSISQTSASIIGATVASKAVANVVDIRRRGMSLSPEEVTDLLDSPNRGKKKKDKVRRFMLEDLLQRFSQEELLYLIRCFHNMDPSSPLYNKPIITPSTNIQNNLIDRLQMGFAMGQLGHNLDQNELFFRHIFNGFFGLSKRLMSRDGENGIVLETKNVRSKTIFVNFWQKHSVANVECIDLDTFLAGMAILIRGTVEERGVFAFDMLDCARQGYLELSDLERAIESAYAVLTDINVDPPSKDYKVVAKSLFDFLDVHKSGKITQGLFIKGLKKDPLFMASLAERPRIDKVPRFTMPDCQKRGTICAFGSRTWTNCLYFMIGLRTVINMTRPLQRDIRKEDFLVEIRIYLPRAYNDDAAVYEGTTDPNTVNQDQTSSSILFLEYAPHVFQKLRESKNISETEYLRSISPDQLIGHLLCGQLTSLSEQLSEGSGGRSGSSFYYTHDGKFIIKQVSTEEFANFRRTLPEYYNYMIQNPDSIVSQFFGCFEFDNGCYIVMRNVFSTAMPIHEIYDLKGSKVSRSSPDGPVYKDLDLHGQTINIGNKSPKRDKVLSCITRDITFLQQLKFTDYSILLGIHFVDGYDKSQRALRIKKFISGDSSPIKIEGEEEQDEESDDRDMISFQEMIMSVNGGALSALEKSSSARDVPVLLTAYNSFSSITEYDPSDDEDFEYKRRHRNSDIQYCEKTVYDFYQFEHNKKLNEKRSAKSKNKKSIFEGGLTSSDGKQVYFLGIIDTLTEFTMKKNAELNLKTLKYPLRRAEISAQPPAEYADRLKKFIANLVT
jgi:Ca2+-binding EF-hand superfamily protein